MKIQYISDAREEVVVVEKMLDGVHYFAGSLVETDESLDVEVMGFGCDFIGLAEKEGDGGKRASLVVDTTVLLGFHAEVGAPTLAVRVDADLFCLLVIDACHMLHG